MKTRMGRIAGALAAAAVMIGLAFVIDDRRFGFLAGVAVFFAFGALTPKRRGGRRDE